VINDLDYMTLLGNVHILCIIWDIFNEIYILCDIDLRLVPMITGRLYYNIFFILNMQYKLQWCDMLYFVVKSLGYMIHGKFTVSMLYVLVVPLFRAIRQGYRLRKLMLFFLIIKMNFRSQNKSHRRQKMSLRSDIEKIR
jgi:hypothetical protein